MTLDAKELGEALTQARAIAEEASAILMKWWRSGVRVQKKGAIDLVTDADLESEACVRERLSKAFPKHAIVGEEGGETRVEGAETAWFIDPLDGTTNFAHGHFFFNVSLGMCVDAAPVLGVVSAPALGCSWFGAKGLGAFRRRAGREEQIGVSTTQALDDALVATGFPYDRRTSAENNFREFEAIKLRAQGVRRCGAAALDLCLVADGTYDGYWEQKLKPWDLCGGTAVIRQAGGVVTDYEGRPAEAGTTQVIATNGHLHDALSGAIREARGVSRA